MRLPGPFRVSVVCEGVTDLPLLEAVIKHSLGAGVLVTGIQPPQDADDSPAGDTQVEAWCKRWAHAIQWLPSTDLLVVHLDGDRQARYDASDAKGLCDVVKGWLDPALRLASPDIVIVLPAQATDLWLYGALFDDISPQDEQRNHPEDRLADKGVLKRHPDGKVRKDPSVYRAHAGKLHDRVPTLRRIYPELDRFAGKLEAVRAKRA